MSKWQFTFPPSRTCLWDTTPTGSATELHITRQSWLCVHVSPTALQLAVRHAKQSPKKIFDCFLIATAWTNEAQGVVLEVDRFDPGRPSSPGLAPTTLIPGDIAIPSQVTVSSHPDAKHLTHNLTTLQQSIKTLKLTLSSHPSPLDPALLLSLRIHCTCSEDGKIDVQCACVYPALTVEATPIKSIAIVQTALARNLGGPLSLSVIQAKVKHGYVTMEASRKLVLLLHSDPKATELPLIGIWVSGVSSLCHPVVWTACVTYVHSSVLCDRVWGEGDSFVSLVYLEGSSKPVFSQCTFSGCGDSETASFEMASGESILQPSSIPSSLSFELYPVQESTSLHTLLETVTSSSSKVLPSHNDGRGNSTSPLKVSCDLVPLPSPQPTPTQLPHRPMRDSELSMLSCLSISSGMDEITNHITTPAVTRSSSHSSPDQFWEDKENTPVNQSLTNKSRQGPELSPTGQYANKDELDESLVMFPDKQSTLSQLPMTPRSDTTKLLRQQEQQLRALQEQVNTLLQAQVQSPATQSLNTTPRAEASTSTGDSLYWPHTLSHNHPSQSSSSHNHPSHSTVSTSSHLPLSRSTFSTPSQSHFLNDTDREESSVCYSSIVSGLTVQTATSILSQNVSDIQLDLQSYAQSPSPPHSPSFGESASVLATRDGDSPANLLLNDKQQFYQNMLCQVNALLRPQDEVSQESSHQTRSASTHSSTSSPSEYSSVQSDRVEPGPQHLSSFEAHTVRSNLTPHSSCNEGTEVQTSSLIGTRKDETCLSNISQTSKANFSCALLDHSLPVHNSAIEPLHLHPDALQQRYSNEVSMLPVPRIVCPVLPDHSTVDTVLFPRNLNIASSTDCTLDENMQLADIIAMKYLGNKLPSEQGSDSLPLAKHIPKGPLLIEGSDSILESGTAHMSMATQQYLRRHHLLDNNGSKAPRNTLNEGGNPTDGDFENDNILNIRRLKMLPKLI